MHKQGPTKSSPGERIDHEIRKPPVKSQLNFLLDLVQDSQLSDPQTSEAWILTETDDGCSHTQGTQESSQVRWEHTPNYNLRAMRDDVHTKDTSQEQIVTLKMEPEPPSLPGMAISFTCNSRNFSSQRLSVRTLNYSACHLHSVDLLQR